MGKVLFPLVFSLFILLVLLCRVSGKELFLVSGVYPTDSALVELGGSNRLDSWDTITVVFNRPVIRLGSNFDTDSPNVTTPFTIDGANVPGRIRWVTTYMARLDSSISWPSDLSFVLRISPSLTTFDGHVIQFDPAHPSQYHFVTDPLYFHVASVTSKSAMEITQKLWNPFLAARSALQTDSDPAQWIQNIPEVPADGILDLSFSSRVDLALLRKALKVQPEGAPSFVLSHCEEGESQSHLSRGPSSSHGVFYPSRRADENCVRVVFGGPLEIGQVYTFSLKKGSVYGPLSGPLVEDLEASFAGPFRFIVPFLEWWKGEYDGENKESVNPTEKRSVTFPMYPTNSLNWYIYLRHGLSHKTTPLQVKECFQVFQRNDTFDRFEEILFDISLPSPSTVSIRGNFLPHLRYQVTFGKSPRCHAFDGYDIAAEYSSITFATSLPPAFESHPYDVMHPIFDTSDHSASALSWTYLTRETLRPPKCEGEFPHDVVANAVSVTRLTLPSVLCSFDSYNYDTFPEPTQVLRYSSISSSTTSPWGAEALAFDTASLLAPTGLFFHWVHSNCGVSFKGLVGSADIHGVTFFIGKSLKTSRMKYAMWALSSESLAPLEGATVTVFSDSMLCEEQSEVKIVTTVTVPESGIASFELDQISYPQTYHAFMEYHGKMQYVGKLFSPFDDNHEDVVTAMIFTDRRLYRPGDPMYVKGYVRSTLRYPMKVPNVAYKYSLSVVWKNDGSETKYPVTFDPKYGSFNLTIEVPQSNGGGVTYGDHSLTLTRPWRGSTEALAWSSVYVGDPRPPTVYLTFTTDDEVIRPDSPDVLLDLKTESYLGIPITGAKVEIRWNVIRGSIPYSAISKSPAATALFGTLSTHPAFVTSPEITVSHGESMDAGTLTVVTDEQGELQYKLSLQLTPPLMDGDSLSLSAEWVGPTGEVVTSSLSVDVANSDLRIYLTPSFTHPVIPHIPFAIFTDLRKGHGEERVGGQVVTLSLVEWDGVTPVVEGSTGKLQIMDSQSGSNFESEEIPYKEWTPEVLGLCTLSVQMRDTNACTFTVPAIGRYLVIAETLDSHNRKVRTFYPVGLNEKEWAENPFVGFGDILLRADRDLSHDEKYTEGDVAIVSFFCPYPIAKVQVFFGHQSDLSGSFKEGAIQMDVTDGPGVKSVKIPIDNRCRGKCPLTLALFRPRGPLSSSPFMVSTTALYDPEAATSHISYLVLPVSSQKSMSIDISLASPTIAPGQQTSIDVLVRDEKTLEPVREAEVCVFAVNRAYIDPLPPLSSLSLSNSLSALAYSPEIFTSAFSTYERLASLSGYEKSIQTFLDVLRIDPWFVPNDWTLRPKGYSRDLVDLSVEEITRLRWDALTLFPTHLYNHGKGVMYEKAPPGGSDGITDSSFSNDASQESSSGSSSSLASAPKLRNNYVITHLHALRVVTDFNGRVTLNYTASDYIGTYTFFAFAASADGDRFGQYPLPPTPSSSSPSSPPLSQLVVPPYASISPLLPRQMHIGDTATVGAIVTCSGASDRVRKFLVRFVSDCGVIELRSEGDVAVEVGVGEMKKEVFFAVEAKGIGNAKIEMSLTEISASATNTPLLLDGFVEYVSVYGCCDAVELSTSAFLLADSKEVPLRYDEGLKLPSAAPHTGHLIHTVGVGFFPAVKSFAVVTFPQFIPDNRDRYSYHLLSKLVPWPALSRYGQEGSVTFKIAKEEHFRALLLLSAATHPVYGLQYSIQTMYPTYNLHLNSLALFLSHRSIEIVGKDTSPPLPLLNIWQNALEQSLYSLGRSGVDTLSFCEDLAFAYLSLGRSWVPPPDYSATLSLDALDSVIQKCSPSARSYRALVDLDADQHTHLLTSLLDSLESAIRVSGRIGYIGNDRWVDVKGSAIGLEALSRAKRHVDEMVGKLASFVGQIVDENADVAVDRALRYGFGDIQIAYSLLSLSSFDYVSKSSRPDVSFQIVCGDSVLLSGSFKGDISKSLAMSSSTPFEEIRNTTVTTWLIGYGAANLRSTLSFVPSHPSGKREDFGIRVEKVIQMMDHTTRTAYGPSVTHLRKGDLVIVTIQVSVPDQYASVQLSDPLPGGLEGLDDRLDNGSLPPLTGAMTDPFSFYFEREFYPGAVEFRAPYLPAGVYAITYQAIAVTEGKFLLPSTKAWLLHTPEVFGLSIASEITILGQSELSISASSTPNCLVMDPSEIVSFETYPDPKPSGGYPLLFDPFQPFIPKEEPFLSPKFLGVFGFAVFGLTIVVVVVWQRKRKYRGYSKFRQMQVDEKGKEEEEEADL